MSWAGLGVPQPLVDCVKSNDNLLKKTKQKKNTGQRALIEVILRHLTKCLFVNLCEVK